MPKLVTGIMTVAVFGLLASLAWAPVAQALSDADYEQMLASSPEFKAADAKLGVAWTALRAAAGARFESILADQRAWVADGRDVEAAVLFNLQPSAPEIAPLGQPDPVLAYARVTLERAAKLDLLAAQLQGGARQLGGKIRRDQLDGTYLFYPYPFLLPFNLCTQADLHALDAATLSLLQEWSERADGVVAVNASFKLPGQYNCTQPISLLPLEGMSWREQDQLLAP